MQSFLAVGKLFTNSRYQINTAYNQALGKYQYKSLLKSGRLPGEILEGKEVGLKAPDLTIADTISHVYNIYEQLHKHGSVKQAKEAVLRLYAPEQIDNRLMRIRQRLYPKCSGHLGKGSLVLCAVFNRA